MALSYLESMFKNQLEDLCNRNAIVCVVLKSGREYMGVPISLENAFELTKPFEVKADCKDLDSEIYQLVPAVISTTVNSIYFEASDIMCLPKVPESNIKYYSSKAAEVYSANTWDKY